MWRSKELKREGKKRLFLSVNCAKGEYPAQATGALRVVSATGFHDQSIPGTTGGVEKRLGSCVLGQAADTFA